MTKKIFDKIMLVSLSLLAVFAYFDSKNLIAIKEIDLLWQNSELWIIFSGMISPAAFSMWVGVLAAIGIIWYIVSKDKSEALALFLVPYTLILFGVQDLIYYFFSPDTITGTMGCWANVLVPVRIISDLLGECCPTPTSFILSAGLGLFVAYKLYKWLRKAKW